MIVKNVQLAGGQVYYLEAGSGPNLLFLHGAIATSEAYTPLLDLFAEKYHVIAPIHPGHGKSFATPQGWKPRDYTTFYQDFLADIGFIPEILIGHSFGGTLALLLAAVGVGKRIIAMDPPGLPFDFNQAAYMMALSREGRDVLKRRTDLQHMAQTMHAAGTVIETVMKHSDDVGKFMKLGPKYNIASQIKTIKIPVHILWGERDEVVPVNLGSRFQMLIPGSLLTVFPGYGHNYPVTDVEFTYNELTKILG